MRTFDWALFELYNDGLISYEEAMRNADSANELRLNIKLKSQRGEPPPRPSCPWHWRRSRPRKNWRKSRREEKLKQQEERRQLEDEQLAKLREKKRLAEAAAQKVR